MTAGWTPGRLARYIDHTLLAPDAPPAAVARLAEEAAEHGFAAVCVPPAHVPLAAGILAGTAVRVGTVISFPLGYAHPAIRIAESLQAIADGAVELDTVLNLSWLKGGEDGRVGDDLAGWAAALRAAQGGLTLKVIVETALLDAAEKERAAHLVAASGADFVKTSTGFAKGGATVEDVALLTRAVQDRSGPGGRIGVKASGGIRDTATALALIAAGAGRLGTSAGIALLRGLSD